MMPNKNNINRRSFLSTSAAIGVFTVAGCAEGAEDEDDESDESDEEQDGTDFEIEEVADDLSNPWAIAFLPNESEMLITELEGNLSLLDRDDGTLERIDGTPEVYAEGQGGLLDVALHPNFPDECWVYLTYSVTNDDGESATALGRGRLDTEEQTLQDFEELYVAEPYIEGDGHFGSRIIFDDDQMLYMTTGDRQLKDFGEDHVSQDTSNGVGATLRFMPDGTIPDDNPFVDDPDAHDAIFSYGHRNSQGMTTHPESGEIWQSEHGEEDGDEINIIEAGGNYGWPIAHYGCEYDTDIPVGDLPDERDDTVNPVYYWECGSGGFPPGGMTFYDGEAFPDWQGDLFVGNLPGEYIGRFTVDERDVEETTPLLDDQEWRIRDVEVAPDTGHLYVVIDEESAPLVRLVPA